MSLNATPFSVRRLFFVGVVGETARLQPGWQMDARQWGRASYPDAGERLRHRKVRTGTTRSCVRKSAYGEFALRLLGGTNSRSLSRRLHLVLARLSKKSALNNRRKSHAHYTLRYQFSDVVGTGGVRLTWIALWPR